MNDIMRKCCKLFALSAAFALLLCASSCGGDKTAASVFQGAEIVDADSEETEAYGETGEDLEYRNSEEDEEDFFEYEYEYEDEDEDEDEDEASSEGVVTTYSDKEEEGADDEKAQNYMLNKNSKKFHYPSCSAVSKMSEKNKLEFNGKKSEIIKMGYSPCGICKP